MAHPDAVKAALATLARGGPERRVRPHPPDGDESPAVGDIAGPHVDDASLDADAVVDAAARAFENVERAARFVDDGGEARLTMVVSRAREAGEDAVADRGQSLLDDLAAYRAAADGRHAEEAAEAADDGAVEVADDGAAEVANGEAAEVANDEAAEVANDEAAEVANDEAAEVANDEAAEVADEGAADGAGPEGTATDRPPPPSDHFRPGRGTLLGAHGIPGDR